MNFVKAPFPRAINQPKVSPEPLVVAEPVPENKKAKKNKAKKEKAKAKKAVAEPAPVVEEEPEPEIEAEPVETEKSKKKKKKNKNKKAEEPAAEPAAAVPAKKEKSQKKQDKLAAKKAAEQDTGDWNVVDEKNAEAVAEPVVDKKKQKPAAKPKNDSLDYLKSMPEELRAKILEEQAKWVGLVQKSAFLLTKNQIKLAHFFINPLSPLRQTPRTCSSQRQRMERPNCSRN